MYIYHIPDKVVYEYPKGGSSLAMAIQYTSNDNSISIDQGIDRLTLNKDEDLQWLIERLQDIQALRKEEKNSSNTENKAA